MKKVFKSLVFIAVAVAMAGLFSACASTQVGYVQESNIRPLTANIEFEDILATANAFAQDLISDPYVLEDIRSEDPRGSNRPVLDYEPIKNRTSQNIDMRAINESIRDQLFRSRLFRFTDRATSQTDVTIMDEQNFGGLVDSSKAVKPGQQTAIGYYLNGSLTEMQASQGRVTQKSYKFSMQLKSLKTGELLWTKEEIVRKQSKRSVF